MGIKGVFSDLRAELPKSEKRKYLKLNYFSKGIVHRTNQSTRIVPKKDTIFKLDKDVKMNIDGLLFLNHNKPKKSRKECLFIMESGTEFSVNGYTEICYNTEVVMFKNSCLEIGSAFINAGVQIRCMDNISIGNNCLIARDVLIMDFDAHKIEFEDGTTNKRTSPIKIGNKVWIGVGAKILEGVSLGDGCVVAAGSVVTKSFPENCLIAGSPAKIIKRNVKWYD